jgi:dephospho-CoA kinase
LNLQFLFDKLLVVYVKPQTQAERLAKRDGITIAEAEHIMKSQLPIDEKAGYADFVIDNEGSLDETRQKVQEVWEALKKSRQN